MSSQGSVRIWWDNEVGAYRLVVPYNKAFLDAMKMLIPVSDRDYQPDTKTWTITERFLSPVQALAEKAFQCKATVVTKAQAQSASTPPSVAKTSTDAVILEFFKLLPREAAEAAYRRACMTLHPDHGGDMERMSKFNAAWQRLVKEIYDRQA